MLLALRSSVKKVRTDEKVRFTTICAAFLAAFFIMFRYLFSQLSYPVLFCIVVLLVLRRVAHFKIDLSDYFWFVYALIMVTFGLVRDDQELAVKRFILLVMMIVIKIILQSDFQKWRDVLYRLLVIFGLIQAFGIFCDVAFPSITQAFRSVANANTEYGDYLKTYSSAVYRLGFTNQAGVAGFCITCLCCVCAVRYIQAEGRRKTLHLILLTIGVFSLLLTGKRALFVEVLFSFFLIAFIYYSGTKQKGTKFFIAGFIVIALFAIIVSQPVFAANVDRLLNGDDAGRAEIWEYLINNFKSSPLVGVGKDVFASQVDMGAHNEYLKVLSENGLLGFSFFILALITPLIEIAVAIIKNRKLLGLVNMSDQKDIIFDLLISVAFQVIIILYSFTGNPLTSPDQTLAYFIFTAIGIGSIRRLYIYARSISKSSIPSTEQRSNIEWNLYRGTNALLPEHAAPALPPVSTTQSPRR